MKNLILPMVSLWQREVVRFLRQPARVIGALVPPILFWFFIGSGLGKSPFQAFSPEENYTQYLFPGTILMIVLFSSIFSTISIIEDRKDGFLQSVIIAPIPRSSIVLGKILGGATLAFFEALSFLLLAPLLKIHYSWNAFFIALLLLFLISAGLTGLGFILAWKMDSTQGFHSVMNLFLMPLWFLSGALFPLESASPWLRLLMILDPLTYGVAGLRAAFYSQTLQSSGNFPSLTLCLSASFIFCLFTFTVSLLVCKRKT